MRKDFVRPTLLIPPIDNSSMRNNLFPRESRKYGGSKVEI